MAFESINLDATEPERWSPPPNFEPLSVEPLPERGEFSKGLIGGLVGGNPKMFGAAIKGAGTIVGSDWLKQQGESLAKLGEENLKDYNPDVPSIANVRTDSFSNALGDFFTKYLPYQAGNALSSMAPTIASGLLGAAAGGAIAGPVGAIAGGFAGTVITGYPMNYGDIYSDATDDAGIQQAVKAGKLTDLDVARITMIAAVPITAIDSWSLGRLGQAFTSELKRSIYQRVFREMANGGLREGTTEGLQQVISEAVQHQLGSDKTLSDHAISVVDNAIGGMAGGGLIQGAAGVVQQTRAPPRQPAPSATPAPSASLAETVAAVTDPTIDLDTSIRRAATIAAAPSDVGRAVDTISGPTPRPLDAALASVTPDILGETPVPAGVEDAIREAGYADMERQRAENIAAATARSDMARRRFAEQETAAAEQARDEAIRRLAREDAEARASRIASQIVAFDARGLTTQTALAYRAALVKKLEALGFEAPQQEQEHAAAIESPTGLDVRQQAGNGEALGGGNAQPQEPAAARPQPAAAPAGFDQRQGAIAPTAQQTQKVTPQQQAIDTDPRLGAEISIGAEFNKVNLAGSEPRWVRGVTPDGHSGRLSTGDSVSVQMAERGRWRVFEERAIPTAHPETPTTATPPPAAVAPQQAPIAQPPAIRQQLFVEWADQRHPVDSLVDASKKWDTFREESGAGVSEIGNGVRVVDQTGKVVARVSYNGRVWPAVEWKPGDKPLYVPEAETPALETKTPPDVLQKAGAIPPAVRINGQLPQDMTPAQLQRIVNAPRGTHFPDQVAVANAEGAAKTGDLFSQPANQLSAADLLRAAASKMDEAAKPAESEAAQKPAPAEPAPNVGTSAQVATMPAEQGKAGREKLQTSLRDRATALRTEASRDLGRFRPIGRASDLASAIGFQTKPNQVALGIQGATYVFKKNSAPTDTEVAAIEDKFKQADALDRESIGLGFSVVDTDRIIGNRLPMEQGIALRRRGLLDPNELEFLDQLEKFWQQYSDAQTGVVRDNGTIEPVYQHGQAPVQESVPFTEREQAQAPEQQPIGSTKTSIPQPISSLRPAIERLIHLKAEAKQAEIDIQPAIDRLKDVVAGKRTAKETALWLRQKSKQFAKVKGTQNIVAALDQGRSALSESTQPNPEPQPSHRVAESQALGNHEVAPGPSDRGVAPTRENGLPKDITDFGEKIGGARKDYAETYRDRMKEAAGMDIAAEPLSKSWPEPDYQKLLDEKADPWSVAFAHAARDEVPTKPQQSWKLSQWVKNITLLRDTTNKIMAGELSAERARELLSDSPVLKPVSDRAALYTIVGHDKSLKGVRISSGTYGIFNRETFDPPKVIWSVERKIKTAAFSRWPDMLSHGATREEAIANFKKAWSATPAEQESKAVEFDIYSRRGTGQFFIGKKIGKNVVTLKDGFATAKEARAWKVEHQADLVKTLEKIKEVPNERSESNAPRVGEEHRNGANVSPAQFNDTFGFRGVEFGNYVEGARRQADLNETYDALMDLAGVLGVPTKALSLNGELALAFGARGMGGRSAGGRAAKAHYEPGKIVINLTKEHGAGSLAHEWFHAVDNYFSRMRGNKAGFVTSQPGARGEGVRVEMLAAFNRVMDAVRSSGVRERSMKLDRARYNPYWGLSHEMAARSFESYVIAKLHDQGASNDYLANIVSQQYWDAAAALGMEKEGTYPYPADADMPAIRAAFDDFFKIVETRETDKGVAMFQTSAPYTNHTVAKFGEQLKANHPKVTTILKEHPNGVIDLSGIQVGDPGLRGQGLGRAAMRELTDFADYQGRGIILTAFPENPSVTPLEKLVQWYRNFGFEPLSEQEYTDATTMFREPQGVAHETVQEIPVRPEGAIQGERAGAEVLRGQEGQRGEPVRPEAAENPAVAAEPQPSTGPSTEGLAVSVPEYNDAQAEAIYDHIETRPGTTPEQKALGVSALRALFGGDRRAGATLLGSALWRGFAERGGAELIGQQAYSAEDLAVAAQILRDPRFETMRVFFTKGGKIIDHTGWTSRMPGGVAFAVGGRRASLNAMTPVDRVIAEREDSAQSRLYQLSAQMKALGADGYYLLHNHPSGASTPSDADKRVTQRVAQVIPGFLGHIVIDHNSFGVIDAAGNSRVRMLPESARVPSATPELAHDMLGTTVMGPTSLVNAAKMLTDGRAGYVTLIATNASGKIQALAEVPESALLGDTKYQQLKAVARIRRFMNRTGSAGGAFIVGQNAERFDGLLANGALTDVVDSGTGKTRIQSGALSGTSMEHGRQTKMVLAANQMQFPGESANILEQEAPGYANTQTMGLAQRMKQAIPQLARDRMGEIGDNLVYNYQNMFYMLPRIQERLHPGALPENMDANLAVEAYPKVVAAKIQDFQDDTVKPFIKLLHDSSLTVDQAQEYVNAKDAPDRNREMRARNPTEAELGAMKTDLAAQRDALAGDENVHDFIAKRRELRQAQADVEDGIADDSLVTMTEAEIAALRTEKAVSDYSAAIDKLRALQSIKPFAGDNTALSGMSDAKAAEVIAKAQQDGTSEALEKVSATVDAITAKTRQILVENGLAKPEEVAAWEAAYPHYVPRFRDEVTNGEGHPIGQGFQVRGKESKRATGSTKEVADILAHVMAAHEAAIIRSEKVKADRALYNFLTAHPGNDVAELDVAPKVRDVDTKTGLVIERVDPLYKNQPNVLTLKIAGDEHTITFNENNPEALRLAAAMKNLSAQDIGEITAMVGKFTRFLAAMNTAANPVFGLRNVIRDSGTAFVNLSDTALENNKKQVFADMPKAIRGMWNMVRGDMNSEWAKRAREFRDAGGVTGFVQHYKDIGARAETLEKQLAAMKPGTMNLTKETALKYWHLIQDANVAVENGIRLSAYVNASKIGMSQAKAISLSNNLTVNFNKRGIRGAELNMWYMFMNASIQGTARLVKAMGNRNVQKVIGYVILSAFLLDLLNRGLAGDGDDDGENDYDQLPDYTKANNFVFWFGRPITIPMPYGYNFFASVGRMMGEAMFRKNYNPAKSAVNLGNVFLDAFSPMGQNGSLLQFAAPTIADPFVQWAENKNFAGNPLRREQLPFGPPKPEYQMGFKSTSAPAKALAEVLNNWTGGNEVRSGLINMNPAAFDFAVTSLLGGAGRTYLQTLSLPIKAAMGDEIQAREVPFVNVFASAKPEYQIERKFFDTIKDVETVKAELKTYHSDPEQLRLIREDHAAEIRMIGMARGTQHMLENIRKRERILEKNKPEGWRDQEKTLEERKNALMSRFNQRYAESRASQ